MNSAEKLNYHNIFNDAQVMMHFSDKNNIIVEINDYWLQKTGYERDEVIGTCTLNYLAKESREFVESKMDTIFSQKQIENMEIQLVKKSGESMCVIASSKIMLDSENRHLGFVTTTVDVSKQKKTEDDLRTRESYLSAIIENQPGLVWLKNEEGRFLAVNQAFANSCEINNPEDLLGKTDLDIWPKDLADKYRSDDDQLMKSGVPIQIEELISVNGIQKWFETFKTPIKDSRDKVIGTTGYAHDITERKLREDALHNMQKLESLGILAGGIAHDFNNLLSGIFNTINIALLVTTEDEVKNILSSTKKVIHRSRSLTKQLLTFAKGGSPVKNVEVMPDFINETVKFALSGSNVTCKFYISEDLNSCEIDKGQIGQVIDNIVINAKQAMPAGGAIEVSVENFIVEKTETGVLKPGDYVKIKITDNGTGIPADVLPKIFDPFYTTKSTGNGLGLATSHSIIKRHGGNIDVETIEGEGTSFIVYLPASKGENKQRLNENKISEINSGTIIVMDDDSLVIDTLKRLLELMEYTVISSNDGEEALKILKTERNNNRTVNAMLLDLTVPGGLGGVDIIDDIREMDKDLPVYVISGYADNPVMSNPVKYGFTGSICKPFTPEEISELFKGKD